MTLGQMAHRALRAVAADFGVTVSDAILAASVEIQAIRLRGELRCSVGGKAMKDASEGIADGVEKIGKAD